eukprot:scaffold17154_cov116-Cyclotella_meneghiniana.AAC.4
MGEFDEKRTKTDTSITVVGKLTRLVDLQQTLANEDHSNTFDTQLLPSSIASTSTTTSRLVSSPAPGSSNTAIASCLTSYYYVGTAAAAL